MDDNWKQMKNDELILVDDNDNQIGISDKYSAHRTENAKLHRAFSILLFDRKSETVLLQKRSEYKLTLPLVWANTCCSHPRPGETIFQAACRRVKFELNIDIEESANKLKEIAVFKYKSVFNEEWTEYEIDHLVFGFFDKTEVNFNRDEVDQVTWVTRDELDKMIEDNPSSFSTWMVKIWYNFLKSNWKLWLEKEVVSNIPQGIVDLT